jgi:hypothetical protein
MDAFDRIAEARIAEALANGELETPLAGAPLDLGDDAHVPEELRAGYRLLRGANCLPPEMEARREVVRLRDLLEACGACGDDSDRARLARELDAATLRFELLMERRHGGAAMREYRGAILRRLGADGPASGG